MLTRRNVHVPTVVIYHQEKNQPSHQNVSHTGVWHRLEAPVIHGSKDANKFRRLSEKTHCKPWKPKVEQDLI